ncbi:Conjugal transfer protein TraG [Petrocella atlantisensis]|uniref:Conjugal transfer protein TraG n=1 Tax=Petrocella atlantisensis TaxID=2173034 RepID=A0A3P7P1E8_9FIRM|nr:type IV secretory system conjugative DNA transfer family protein [Petrocella atlantisensis]VDN47310.1 Conjugal transfer protein TraG [Petrocella atlantisensis]
MKYKRIKLLMSVLIFLVGLWLNIHFSTTLHFALIGKFEVLRWIGFDECIRSMKVNESHWHLFMCLQGFVLLSAIYYYIANHKPYQSNLMQITPDISTPVSAGQKQFGSARWMTDQEKEKEFRCYEMDKSGETQIPSGGIVLGKKNKGLSEHIYYVDDDTHVLCIGATRSGKTRSIVLQTIGTLALAEESMIISDPKGELYNYTYPFLEKKGYEIICLDFKNPLKSDRYNFLQPVIDAIDKNDIPMAIDATWDLTASLVPEDNHNEKIWVNGEASIIAAAIISVVYDNRNGNDRRFQNLSNVYFFISEMCKTVNNSMPLIKYMKNMPTSHPAKALLSISEVAPSKTRGSFYTSALTTLRLFTNPLIHQMTNISDLRLEDFGDKKQVIYMILPDEKSTYYSLASLFVNQCYMQLVKNADSRGGRLKRRINFCLDEFGNFVKIPDFSNKLTVGGGRGIRFNLFLQSFMQLDEKYGKEAAGTIKSNCETWIYLQADDLSTLEEISKKLGNYTVSTYSLTSSHGKHTTPSSSHSINLTHRALLSVDEIRLISRPYSLITSRNNPAIMEAPDLSKWYFNKLFGLGDKEHNRKVREEREKKREARRSANEIDTWNIWDYYSNSGNSHVTYEKFTKGDI